jgi:hypothetical protein
MSKPNLRKALIYVIRSGQRGVPSMQALAMPELDRLLELGLVEFGSGSLRATKKGVDLIGKAAAPKRLVGGKVVYG